MHILSRARGLALVPLAAAAVQAPRADHSGTWVLDPARSEHVPALWRGASDVTLTVSQDPTELTYHLRVNASSGRYDYGPFTYALDGSERTVAKGGERPAVVTLQARWVDAGKALELRSLHTGTLAAGAVRGTVTDRLSERWESAENGRVLRIRRILENRAVRSESNLVFTRK